MASHCYEALDFSRHEVRVFNFVDPTESPRPDLVCIVLQHVSLDDKNKVLRNVFAAFI